MPCCPRCGYTVVLPSNPVQQWNFESIGMIGTPVLAGVDGINVQFYTIASGNSSLLVNLDAGNGAVLITLDINSIVLDLPQATTSVRGIGETSTDLEAAAKASTTTFLTPSNLNALGSSQTFAGLVELATSAETQAGISTTLAVTPAGLASVTALIQGTTTWADAATRAGADPDFAGAIGVQLDTVIPYVAIGPSVGDFVLPFFMLDTTQNVMSTTTQLDLNTLTLTFQSGDFVFQGGAFSCDNGNARFGSSASLDFDFGSNCRVSAANVIVPANSVFITAGTAGEVSSSLINTFLSSANTQTGYTPVTNGAVRRTFDCNTVTLPELAQAWGTLVEDLKAVLLPAT